MEDQMPNSVNPSLRLNCEICDSETKLVGSKVGQWRKRTYRLRHCLNCGFSFVENPDTDFINIYNEDYYAGKGADPKIDYTFEWRNPTKTIRQYEWIGISQVISQIAKLGPETTWLDYGCGTGGLVRWVTEKYGCRAFGYETGIAAKNLQGSEITILNETELAETEAQFDIISAVEVLEHVIQPLQILNQIARLLKPGGLFFFTTGNAQPFQHNLSSWSYVVPEIHLSFYEPKTFALAFQKSGFAPLIPKFDPGFTNIIKYKLLKKFEFKQANPTLNLVPWTVVSRIVDMRYNITEFPIGIKL